MSGLTKKAVYVDKVLAKILGVDEGTQVSYAELSKGLHKYIRENGLKNSTVAAVAPAAPATVSMFAPGASQTTAAIKKCGVCESEIPVEAVFCDLCGARQ